VKRRCLLFLSALTGVCCIAPAVATADYRSTVLADSPMAYHRMDDSVGAATGTSPMADETTCASLCQFTNTAGEGSGDMGQDGALPFESVNRAIFFNGNNSDPQFAQSVPEHVLDSFSLEIWIKTSAAALAPTFQQWWDGVGLIDADVGDTTSDFGLSILEGKAAFGVGGPDTTIVSPAPVNTGVWTHIVATRSAGGAMKLYVNGALKASNDTGPIGPRTAANPVTGLTIGASALLGPHQYFQGLLDEVAIYPSVLPAARVTAHYQAATAETSQPTGTVRVRARGAGRGNIFGQGIACVDNGTTIGNTGDCTERYDTPASVPLTANPLTGSRFAGWSYTIPGEAGEKTCGTGCTFPIRTNKETTVAANFHLAPMNLASQIYGELGALAPGIEGQLDDGANPKKRKGAGLDPISLIRGSLDSGAIGGALMISMPKSGAKLIGADGSSLVGPDGSSLVGPDGSSFKPTATSPLSAIQGLVGPDGSSLLGDDGVTAFISDGGGQLVGPDGGSLRAKKKTVRVQLATYATTVSDTAEKSVVLQPTKLGKKFFKTWGQMNAALKKPKALNVTFIEALKPSDGKSSGIGVETIKVK
jgi:hypothetical protein